MLPADPITLHTFDGGLRTCTKVMRPDRYRQFEQLDFPFTVRGGGYSYSAASFAADRPVLDLRAFNRVLRFAPEAGEIEVEAGLTLGALLQFLTPRGFWCPVIPGYPAITVGGCIAADVHGKSQSLHGNFRHWTKQVALAGFGPELTICSREQNAELFELSCGGLGLTGPIVRATLRIIPLLGGQVTTERSAVGSVQEGYARLRTAETNAEFAYSWHRPWCVGDRSFGPGFVFQGATIPGTPLPRAEEFAYRPLAPDAVDRRIPASLFGGPGNLGTRAAYVLAAAMQTNRRMMTDSLFASLFPFVAQAHYFHAFGRRGLQEVQVLVPHASADSFLDELEALCRQTRPPAAVIALKLFQGERCALRYDGEGLSIAIDLARHPATDRFLERFDHLCRDYRPRLNLLKDSRLNRTTFEHCYPEAEEFRGALRRHGLLGKYASTLAARLGLA